MRNNWIMVIGLLGALGVLAAGCGDDDSGARAEGAGGAAASPAVLPQKLTQPNMKSVPEPDASPAEDASFAENLAYELRSKTLKMAQAPGDTTASCPKKISSTSGTTVTCTTTYEDLTITWKVTLGDKAAWSDNYVTFEAAPDQGLITQEGVAKLLYGNYRDSIDYALCNNIPKAVLAPLDQPSKYSCEVVDKGTAPTGYSTPVRATEAGPRAY